MTDYGSDVIIILTLHREHTVQYPYRGPSRCHLERPALYGRYGEFDVTVLEDDLPLGGALLHPDLGI